MSEHKPSEYLTEFINSLDHAVSLLSEIATMEMRRKLLTVGAIIRSVRPVFYEFLSIQMEIKARQKSIAPRIWLIASLVGGGIIHFVLRDPNSHFDFTLGFFIAAFGFISWITYGLATAKMARALRDSQGAIDEMLYRWIANGGDDRKFWELRDQIDMDAGDIDMDSDRYRQWWYEMKGDLLDSTNGETIGLGSWRPTRSTWQ